MKFFDTLLILLGECCQSLFPLCLTLPAEARIPAARAHPVPENISPSPAFQPHLRTD